MGRGSATKFRNIDHETSIFYFLFHDCDWLLAVLYLGVSGALFWCLLTRSCSGLASYIDTLVLLEAYDDEHTGTNPAKSVGAVITR